VQGISSVGEAGLLCGVRYLIGGAVTALSWLHVNCCSDSLLENALSWIFYIKISEQNFHLVCENHLQCMNNISVDITLILNCGMYIQASNIGQ
jgi:hypothetical protein